MQYPRKIRMEFSSVVGKVIQNLKAQGFTNVSDIDINKSLGQSLGIKFRNYKILVVLNPRFAYEVISLESHLGAMMTCSVVIQEHENEEVEVSAINPLENLDSSSSTLQLAEVAQEMGVRLRAAMDFIQREMPENHLEVLPAARSVG